MNILIINLFLFFISYCFALECKRYSINDVVAGNAIDLGNKILAARERNETCDEDDSYCVTYFRHYKLSNITITLRSCESFWRLILMLNSNRGDDNINNNCENHDGKLHENDSFEYSVNCCKTDFCNE
ncbi:hypothetical protein Mgra_00002897 [Meloidogyne graminicola]|uniref:Uncharacterized protein n=1 Tax=Meloidogyne graminicola TaxID=189291 RepID=A0A8S9ZVH1_9BILA|nr:hypothetical protein Mgra_00002897 [Meloidogyne graminicola]